MGLEIERKFLVKDQSYRSLAYDRYKIIQGYIAQENGRSVRVRITDKEYVLTIKGPADCKGISRFEWNNCISLDDARELINLCQGMLIEKTRFLVRSEEHIFEIDEFVNRNSGLVIAEVELRSEQEAFNKPDFIGREVTGDHRYYNAYLAHTPFDKWIF